MAPAGPKGQGDVTQVASLVSVLQSHLGGNAKKPFSSFLSGQQKYSFMCTTAEDLKAAK